jgi:hypothetical protein
MLKKLSNSNFDYQASPFLEAQSTMTINTCGNLKLAKKIKQYPVRSVLVSIVIVIVLSVSITCIAVFSKNRNPIEAAMTAHNVTTTIVVRF